MTLLHQAAQKAVEALTSASAGLDYFLTVKQDMPFVAGARNDLRTALEALSALQQQPEPVGEIVMFGGYMKEVSWRKGKMPEPGAKLYTAPPALQQQEVPREPVGHVHKDWHASQGQGRIYGHCPGSDYVQVYASPSTTQQQEVGSEPDAMEAHRTNGLAWAVSCWEAEVKNRPLVNVHRRTLDDTWRQVIRYFGGDPDKLLGPNHDTLHMRAQEERAWKP